MLNQPTKFAFVDEGEALRRLGLDRDTLLTLVREKRLRAYPGVGKENFYRIADIDALYASLHAEADRAARAEHEATDGATPNPPGRKLFDPAYKVYVRLQADLKWYDLEDEDLKAWVREMHEDGYARQRSNIRMVISKLERMIALMDEAAAGWQTLKPTLPMLPTAPTPPTPIAPTSTSQPAAATAPNTKRRRASLPMFGATTTPNASATPNANERSAPASADDTPARDDA